MIGPPGLPKFGRRVFSSRMPGLTLAPRPNTWKWVAGLYLAGVLAHFSHHLAFDITDPSFVEALTSAPVSLAWPADLIQTLVEMS